MLDCGETTHEEASFSINESVPDRDGPASTADFTLQSAELCLSERELIFSEFVW